MFTLNVRYAVMLGLYRLTSVGSVLLKVIVA